VRDNLKKIDGLRKEFTGVFVRFGKKTNFKGYPETTILLQDVKCKSNSKIETDHLWFNLTKEFDKIGLQEGDLVEFHARVKEYAKGYRANRYEEDCESSLSVDYKLSHPTKVKLIKR